MNITVTPVTEPAHLEQVRALFVEYQRHIGVDLCFQGFQAELDALPGAYAPPSGRLLLGWNGEDAVGCIALRKLTETACEMKRLYVRPAFHGQGLGKRLATTLIHEARDIGYEVLRLDTLPSMKDAARLYRSIGFKPVAPYYANPVAGTVFMELTLRSA